MTVAIGLYYCIHTYIITYIYVYIIIYVLLLHVHIYIILTTGSNFINKSDYSFVRLWV